jgi:ganglioside-induced differentiation-associated protein 1
MIELYHHGSSVCAAKVRFVLAEKDVAWTGHYVDILKGDQFDPSYLKLNAKAVVPTLVHDGVVVPESSVICEYLDEVFCRPAVAARRRARTRENAAVDQGRR